MIVGIRDIFKMTGIIILTFCAVFVCTLFINYNIDIKEIEPAITNDAMHVMYDALVMTGNVVVGVSGGCLLLTSVVMLIFYIRQYVAAHRRELGILKAMGYSDFQIAKGFLSFGISVFAGTSLGYLASFCIMPKFYEQQNKSGSFIEVSMHFHAQTLLWLIILPALFFAALSAAYALIYLKMPVLTLLRGKADGKVRKARRETDLPFVRELKKSTLRQKKTLVFFMLFAAFCYSAMMQMSFSMDGLSSRMMAVMMFVIGMVLAFVSLFLASTTVIQSNQKSAAMMKIFGYSQRQCSSAILSGYRPAAYIGFAIGTVYQYGLLKLMVSVIFADVAEMPSYDFDVKGFLITLVSFIVIYELIMYLYAKKMNRVSLKEIMMASE